MIVVDHKLVFALLAFSLLLFGCASQPQQPAGPSAGGETMQPSQPPADEDDPGVELVPEIDDVPMDEGD